jgi:myb proto-oncogene protein
MNTNMYTKRYHLFNSDVNNNHNIFSIVKVKNKKKWTKQEDELLIELADRFKEKHWKDISSSFNNKNALQCFSRYKRIRPGIIKGSWSPDEDEQILRLVTIYGKCWSKISKILVSRNGKQIRDRFINVLDPEIKKGKFTDKEDRQLIKLYLLYGPRWAIISKHFEYRTADMVKNRFHSSIKKLLYGGSKTVDRNILKVIFFYSRI